MKSTICRLALAVGALLAISGIATQLAQAHVFVSSSEKTALTGKFDGESKDELFFSTSNGFKTVCNSATFEGTQSGTEAPATTITPTYGSTTKPSGCEIVGVGEEIYHTNHCAYVLFGITNAEGDAPVEIECEGEKENKMQITVPSLGATLSIGAQRPEGGVHYTNAEEGGHKVVTVHAAVKGIHVTCAPAIVCAFAGGTEQVEDYNGTHLVRGYEDLGTAATGTAKTTPSLAGSEGGQLNISVNPG